MLSIVTASRNDDHGGHLANRTQKHVDCICQQANDFQKEIEYILVEWNPPDDRLPITSVVNFHHDTPYWHPKIITVPSDIHYTFKNSGRLPFYQMIAKNVGIRRAKGDWILATNIDVLLGHVIFGMSTDNDLLQHNTNYRVDRLDVPANVPDGHAKNMLCWCEKHVIRRNAKYAIETCNGTFRDRCYRFYHSTKRHLANSLMGFPDIHLMANGDFHLFHRDHWIGLRGYAEVDRFSPGIDDLLLLAAYRSGIKEQWLPFPIYHIEHDGGMAPEKDKALFEGLDKKGIPYYTVRDLLRIDQGMRNDTAQEYRKRDGYFSYNWNFSDWGLADYDLPVVSP